MSFTFGASTGTPASGAGFSFGNTTAKTQTTTQSSFTLGQSTTQTLGQTGGGFSFGASPAQTPKAAGITFGTPNMGGQFNTPTTAANTGTPVQGQQSTTGGFTLGGSTGGSLLGAALGNTAAPKSLFGASQQGTASPASGSFTGAAQPAGFSLGGSLGGQTPAQTLGGTTASPAGGFTLGGSTKPQTSGFTLGGSTAAQPTGLTPGSTQASTGFALGGGTTQPSGLTLGGNTAPPSGTAAPVTGGLTVGSSTGFNLGSLGQKTTAAIPATQTGTTGGFQLGGGQKLGEAVKPSASVSATPSQSFAAPAKTTAPVLTLGGLGGATSQAQTLGQTLGTAKTTGTVIAQPSTSVAPGATLSTATTTTSASTIPQSSMNYRQLEEAINKWTLELEEQEKIFLEQATQVNAWDRLLIDNGDKITQLNTNVEQVKIDQQRLDQELDFILSQQKELEELVVPLEQAVDSLPPLAYQQHADIERERTYKLAENIDAQLKTMSRDLKEIIEHLNTSNTNKDSADPIIQISKILNAHMDSLTWVDQNAALLQRKVEDVSRQVDVQKKQQDRSFRHGYD